MTKQRTHCRKGHELTSDNIYHPASNPLANHCRACKKNGEIRFKQRNPLRDVWAAMIRRCTDPSFKDWHIYGGRKDNPVTVYPRWYSYEAFCEDIPPRTSKKHTLDRIDGTKGYWPGNVRWATARQQSRNTMRNVFFQHEGRSMILIDWATETGINLGTLYYRIQHGMTLTEAIIIPIGLPKSKKGRVNSRSKIFTFNGKTMSMTDWAIELGIDYGTLKGRIKRGMPFELALTAEKFKSGKKRH